MLRCALMRKQCSIQTIIWGNAQFFCAPMCWLFVSGCAGQCLTLMHLDLSYWCVGGSLLTGISQVCWVQKYSICNSFSLILLVLRNISFGAQLYAIHINLALEYAGAVQKITSPILERAWSDFYKRCGISQVASVQLLSTIIMLSSWFNYYDRIHYKFDLNYGETSLPVVVKTCRYYWANSVISMSNFPVDVGFQGIHCLPSVHCTSCWADKAI